MKRLRPVLFGTLLTILCLALLEFTFALLITSYRLYQIARTSDGTTPQVDPNEPGPFWSLDAYLPGHFIKTEGRKHEIAGFPVSINSHGFRGPEIADVPKKVACIGDSVTFGWSASNDENTYPALLKKRLNKADTEVINAGMPKWTSMDLLDLYILKVAPLNPKVVVLMMGWNDIGYQHSQPLPITSLPSKKKSEETWAAIADSISIARMARFVGRLINSQTPQRNLASVELTQEDEAILKEADNRPDPIDWKGFDDYEKILRDFVRLIRLHGSTPVLVPLMNFLKPEMSWEEKKTMLPHIKGWSLLSYKGWHGMVEEANRRVERVAKDLNVPLVEHQKKVPHTLFTDIAHLNDEGNAILAENISKIVEKLLLLP
jgi:lysophospholipase L1-like esterase